MPQHNANNFANASQLPTGEGVAPGRQAKLRGVSLEQALEHFLSSLESKNRAQGTRVAYCTDVEQFLSWLHDNNLTAQSPADIERADITDYLTSLGRAGVSGITRARKLAAIREYFRFLEGERLIVKSPTAGVETPKKEKHLRSYLLPDEYNRMLSLAGSDPRDFCILQTFLQTGVRVSELCSLRLDDIDIAGQTLHIREGKGMVARDVELEKKAIAAVKNYLLIRPAAPDDRLFLNRYGQPIGERGVRKLVVKYRTRAGINKKVSCHSLRHTFATYNAGIIGVVKEQAIAPEMVQDCGRAVVEKANLLQTGELGLPPLGIDK